MIFDIYIFRSSESRKVPVAFRMVVLTVLLCCGASIFFSDEVLLWNGTLCMWYACSILRWRWSLSFSWLGQLMSTCSALCTSSPQEQFGVVANLILCICYFKQLWPLSSLRSLDSAFVLMSDLYLVVVTLG